MAAMDDATGHDHSTTNKGPQIPTAGIATDAVSAAKLNSDVPRAGYGLSQHTDGTLQVDPSDTNPCVELTDGGLRAKVDDSTIERASGGLQIKNTGVTEAKLASSAVSQSKLKTSSGEVSLAVVTNNTSFLYSNLTLPGGEYGFYPRTRVYCNIGSPGDTGTMCASILGGDAIDALSITNGDTGYITYIRLGVRQTGNAGVNAVAYANQRYITTSGKDHWIFLLVDKITKQIVSAYQAPDHPCANQDDATELDIPHPFGSYDPDKHEIVIVDNDMLSIAKQKLTRKRSLLTVINEDFIIDDYIRPKYEPREIIKINEFPDDPLGEQLEIIKTPQWAKILIKPDYISRDRRIVEKLPDNILYKKMALK